MDDPNDPTLDFICPTLGCGKIHHLRRSWFTPTFRLSCPFCRQERILDLEKMPEAKEYFEAKTKGRSM